MWEKCKDAYFEAREIEECGSGNDAYGAVTKWVVNIPLQSR